MNFLALPESLFVSNAAQFVSEFFIFLIDTIYPVSHTEGVRTRNKLHARIHGVFNNPVPMLLLDIDGLVRANLEESFRNHEGRMSFRDTCGGMARIRSKLRKLNHKLRGLSLPRPDPDHDVIEFLKCAGDPELDPDLIFMDLHAWAIEKSLDRQSFMDSLIVCGVVSTDDCRAFQADYILLMLQARYLRAVYLILHLHSALRSLHIEQLDNMADQIGQVSDLMTRLIGGAESKTSLLSGCENPCHRHCCFESNIVKCSKVGAHLYQFAGEVLRRPHVSMYSGLAREESEKLRVRFPAFHWSVVVCDDSNQQVSVLVGENFDQYVWIEHFGSTKSDLWSLRRSRRHQDVPYRGSGIYGVISCCRIWSDGRKLAVIAIWAHRRVITSGNTFDEHNKFVTFCEREGIASNATGAHDLLAFVRDRNQQYVFHLQVRKNAKIEGESIGYHIDSEDDVFPLTFWCGNDLTMMCLAPTASICTR
ncbi:hypothetical protein BV898_15667 [Hypsibius exemplaris]|uniref:Uncharacterized protein n=1 Tax=Hypsibius exemplaris TaxID=2072580 RepID=A0A9X6NKL5_HYPEX|nr:hypothetical protein BV898_15667 [Hypsibius exemplaris]